MQDAVYYAYFAPYSYERHQDLIAKSTSNKQVRLEVLGETLDGHDIDLLQIGKKLVLIKHLWSWLSPHLSANMPVVHTLMYSSHWL